MPASQKIIFHQGEDSSSSIQYKKKLLHKKTFTSLKSECSQNRVDKIDVNVFQKRVPALNTVLTKSFVYKKSASVAFIKCFPPLFD